MGDSPAVWTDGFDGPPGEFPEWHRVLTTEIVPTPDAPFHPDIAEFALTFDGYAAFVGAGKLGEMANRVMDDWFETGDLPGDLVVLRSCLFFEQRRYRHFGEGPDEPDMPYLRALVEGIRAFVAAPFVDWDSHFDAMLAKWTDVEREIEERRQRMAEQVASEWNGTFEAMTGHYLELVAHGLWRRGPSDLFNVIGIGRREVRHSAMIAWLLDPLARHGLGPAMVQALLGSCFPDGDFDTSGSMMVETEVARGDTRADIVAWGRDFTLIIEVKVDAGEGDRQCDRLYEQFGGESGALFLFLTPSGRKPKTATDEAAQVFRTLSFSLMRRFLEDAMRRSETAQRDMGRSTVRNYFHTLEKEFR